MKTMDAILRGISIFAIVGLCIGFVHMASNPAIAHVEAPLPEPPTAYLYDSTTVQVAHSKAALQIVRFRDGTVCVVASVYHTSEIELQCDFSRSGTVHKK